jgi:lipoprotein-anchoring transpeptidase ErfK/SrfK
VRKAIFLGLVVVAAGCGSQARKAAPPIVSAHRSTPADVTSARAPKPVCEAGTIRQLGSASRAYAGFAANGAVAYRVPGGAVVTRVPRLNANGYPAYFGVLAVRLGTDCRARWYRVQLPIRPNGATGWVRASTLELRQVRTRIVVSVSRRRLTLFDGGHPVLSSKVAVGSPATPTPLGRYYVNQRLVPTDTNGPYGPGALGISAYSPVLTGWAQGGPVAIHGTNEPWSIGRAVSNGCIRLPNATLERVFGVVDAGTPVIIQA